MGTDWPKLSSCELEFVRGIIWGRRTKDVAEMFNARFGRSVTAGEMAAVCQNRRLRNGLRRRIYTPGQMDFFRNTMEKGLRRTYAGIAEEFNLRFGTNIDRQNARRLAVRMGLDGLLSSRRSAGSLHRGGSGGVIHVKTESGKWANRLAVLWEKSNGEIPEGHFVIPADRDTGNTDTGNMLLVTRGELGFMQLNGLYSADPDITRIGLAMARLKIKEAGIRRERFGRRDRKQKRPGREDVE